MNAKAVFLVGALITCAVGSGVAWKNHRQTEQTLFDQTRVHRERDELSQKLLVLRARLESLFARLEQNKATHEASRISSPKSEKPSGTPFLTSLQLVDKDPRLQILSAKAHHGRARKIYAALYRRLNLTPEQIARFENNCSELIEKQSDINAAASSHGLSMADKSVQKLYSEAGSEFHLAMKNLLGDGGYQTLQDYERSAGCRSVLSDVAASALVAGTTFSSLQLEQLVSILANSTPKFASGGYADTRAIDWEIVDAQARTILTEAQFAAFSSMETSSGRFNSRLNSAVAAARKADADALKSPSAAD